MGRAPRALPGRVREVPVHLGVVGLGESCRRARRTNRRAGPVGGGPSSPRTTHADKLARGRGRVPGERARSGPVYPWTRTNTPPTPNSTSPTAVQTYSTTEGTLSAVTASMSSTSAATARSTAPRRRVRCCERRGEGGTVGPDTGHAVHRHPLQELVGDVLEAQGPGDGHPELGTLDDQLLDPSDVGPPPWTPPWWSSSAAARSSSGRAGDEVGLVLLQSLGGTECLLVTHDTALLSLFSAPPRLPIVPVRQAWPTPWRTLSPSRPGRAAPARRGAPSNRWLVDDAPRQGSLEGQSLQMDVRLGPCRAG